MLQGITGVNEAVRLKATIIGPNIYCANSANYITIRSKTIDIHYLLGLLNCKLLNFVFASFSTNSNVNGYEVDNLPLRLSDNSPILAIVERILAITGQSDYQHNLQDKRVAALERQLDNAVYVLYGLTEEEIAIVEDPIPERALK